MKKTIIAALALIMGSFTAANAQDTQLQTELQAEVKTDAIPQIKPVFVTVYGGPTFSINENGASYFHFDRETELIDWIQGGISAGYYFSNRYGARIAFEYSNNHSAANHDDTNEHGFYPYTFKSGAVFADYIINGGNVDKIKKFNWRPYVGVGAAYSFDRTDSGHPWQGKYFTDNNLCYAFRYGLMLEYDFCEAFGIYVDGNHEWFSDNFNGMAPREGNVRSGKRLGFPFDMKLNANFGLAIHF